MVSAGSFFSIIPTCSFVNVCRYLLHGPFRKHLVRAGCHSQCPATMPEMEILAILLESRKIIYTAFISSFQESSCFSDQYHSRIYFIVQSLIDRSPIFSFQSSSHCCYTPQRHWDFLQHASLQHQHRRCHYGGFGGLSNIK